MWNNLNLAILLFRKAQWRSDWNTGHVQVRFQSRSVSCMSNTGEMTGQERQQTWGCTMVASATNMHRSFCPLLVSHLSQPLLFQLCVEFIKDSLTVEQACEALQVSCIAPNCALSASPYSLSLKNRGSQWMIQWYFLCRYSSCFLLKDMQLQWLMGEGLGDICPGALEMM